MIDVEYDSDLDYFNFLGVDSDGLVNVTMSISREELLQRLLEWSAEYGDGFTNFDGKLPGEADYEPTEMTFLSPPTCDCIGDDEE